MECYRRRQTTDNDDICHRAKQYWPLHYEQNKDIDLVKESTNAKIQAVMEEMKTIKTDIQGQSCELESLKRELKNEVKADLAHRTQDIAVMKQEMHNLETTIGSVKGEMKNEIHEVKTRQRPSQT